MILVGYINKDRIGNNEQWFDGEIENFIEMYDNIIEYEEEIYYKIISYEIDDTDYINDYGTIFTKIKLEEEFLYVNEFEEDCGYDEEEIYLPIIKEDDSTDKYNILVLNFDFNFDNNFILIIDEMNISYDELKDYYEEYLDYI